jgi:hypothetical protein
MPVDIFKGYEMNKIRNKRNPNMFLGRMGTKKDPVSKT